MGTKEILDNWKADRRIDKSDLIGATLSTPELHEKYLRLYYEAQGRLRKLELDLKNLTLAKREFYTIGPVKETKELGWEYRPKRKLVKGEVKDWVEADPDVQKLLLKVGDVQDEVDCLKAVIDAVKDRHWSIKHAMDYERWQAGISG